MSWRPMRSSGSCPDDGPTGTWANALLTATADLDDADLQEVVLYAQLK